ncbi:MAG TPA: hypothetical protein VGJ63_20860 [Micromonosporaceae bacterium]
MTDNADRPAAAPDPPADADNVVRTGHPAVDAAVRALADAADLPPIDQIAEYEAANRTLQETLASIDDA